MPADDHPDEFDEPGRDPNPILTSADYAQAGAFALDAYHAGVLPDSGADHRTNPLHAEELLGALLHDLLHYADRYKVDFRTVARAALVDYLDGRLDEVAFRPGTLVQLTRDAADDPELAGLPRRGVVTDVALTPGRPTTYQVRSPGEPASYSLGAHHLEPGPPFRPIPTRKGIIDAPLDAERALVHTVARLGLADRLHHPPHPSDLKDRQALLTALSSWAGVSEQRLVDLLGPRFDKELQRLENPAELAEPDHHPAALAATDFPLVPGADPPSGGLGNDGPYRPKGPRRGPSRGPH